MLTRKLPTTPSSPHSKPLPKPLPLSPHSKSPLRFTSPQLNIIPTKHLEAHRKKDSEDPLSQPFRPFNSNPKTSQQEMRQPRQSNFANCSYLQTLSQIDLILQQCQRLRSQFGYFYLTSKMIDFDPQRGQVQCWVHPVRSSLKPLHPIVKSTEAEAEREFYHHLKLVLKELYPSIYLPANLCGVELAEHFSRLKQKMSLKLQRKSSMAKLLETRQTLVRVKSEEQNLREKHKLLNELLKQTPSHKVNSQLMKSDSLQRKSPDSGVVRHSRFQED